jgi:hypothetical protein
VVSRIIGPAFPSEPAPLAGRRVEVNALWSQFQGAKEGRTGRRSQALLRERPLAQLQIAQAERA